MTSGFIGGLMAFGLIGLFGVLGMLMAGYLSWVLSDKED